MIAASACLAAASLHGGCSLGLDPSLIGAMDGSMGMGDGPAGDTEAASDAAPPDGGIVIPSGECQTDADCANEAKAAGACIPMGGAKCDPTFHVCLFDVCKSPACMAAVCDQAMKTCSVPETFGFATTSFPVQYGGTGPDGPYWSIAAAYPYVFVITNNGAVAYLVNDPRNGSPPVVPINNLPYVPGIVVAAGRRVMFFHGVVASSGPNEFRQPVAWIDVPQNPFITSFSANNAFIGLKAGDGFNYALSDHSKGAWAVYASKFLDTADLVPPLANEPPITTFPNTGLDPNAGIAAASGTRFIASAYDGMNGVPRLSLITGVGTANAQASSLADFNGAGQVSPQWNVATGDDGAVAWSLAPYDVGDAGPIGIGSTRVGVLLNNAMDGTFETSGYVDIEKYPFEPGGGSRVVGPIAWVDANTMLVTAAAPSDMTLNTTSVQVMTKKPAALVKGLRTEIPVDPGNVGVAASGGYAYVLIPDLPKNQSATVYIFAPSCGGGAD